MLEQRMIVEETPEMDRFLRNFALPEKPHSLLPVVPRNLADISEVELMSLYSEFMSWVNYAKAQLVTAEIVEETEPVVDPIVVQLVVNKEEVKTEIIHKSTYSLNFSPPPSLGK